MNINTCFIGLLVTFVKVVAAGAAPLQQGALSAAERLYDSRIPTRRKQDGVEQRGRSPDINCLFKRFNQEIHNSLTTGGFGLSRRCVCGRYYEQVLRDLNTVR